MFMIRVTPEPALEAAVDDKNIVCSVTFGNETMPEHLETEDEEDDEQLEDDVNELKSCCYNDYFDTNQNLIPIAIKIFDVLFCSPTRTPWSEGNGIIISADSCYGNTPTINIHRKSYLCQNYGLDSTEVQSINKDGIFRYSYGTGSGLNTVGIPRRQVSKIILIIFEKYVSYIFLLFYSQLAIRPFSEDLKTIAQNIECFLHKQYRSDKTVILKPFTTATIITYVNKMTISAHRDQTFKKDGSFDQSQNSQIKNTITAIICFGDTRQLDFSLHRHTKRHIQKVCNIKSFKLSHGTLFVLHPQDEVPLVRKFNKKEELSFFKHSSNGVMKGGMSLGIVFRSTRNLCEVNKKMGCVFFSHENESERIKNADKVLLEYTSGKKKVEDESYLRSMWNRCKERNFI